MVELAHTGSFDSRRYWIGSILNLRNLLCDLHHHPNENVSQSLNITHLPHCFPPRHYSLVHRILHAALFYGSVILYPHISRRSRASSNINGCPFSWVGRHSRSQNGTLPMESLDRLDNCHPRLRAIIPTWCRNKYPSMDISPPRIGNRNGIAFPRHESIYPS